MCEYLLSLSLSLPSAPIGIFQIEPSNNTVSLDEGESYLAELIFLAYIGQLDINMDPNLYKVSASGDLVLVPSNNSGVSINRIVSITDYCHTGLLSAPDPKPVRVVIRNPGIADSGTYAVIVTIDGVNYTANFTINGKKKKTHFSIINCLSFLLPPLSLSFSLSISTTNHISLPHYN